jgi:hypothetical protein
MNRRTSNPARLLFGAVAIITAFTLAGCGSNKHNATSSSSPPTQSTTASSATGPSTSGPTSSGSGAPLTGAAAQIKQNWEKFFSGVTSANEKVGLLQNGAQFQQAIEAQANSAIAKSAGAAVSAVTVDGSQATVTYSVTLGGQPALSDQKGQAVLDGGTWKVSDASFCQLLALENGGSTSGLPPACGAAASGNPASPAG